MASVYVVIFIIHLTLASVPIVLKIPLTVDLTYPVNQYIRTRYGFRPLSIRTLMKYTEIPPKFTISAGKKIMLDEARDRNGGRILSGSFQGFSGRKRMVKWMNVLRNETEFSVCYGRKKMLEYNFIYLSEFSSHISTSPPSPFLQCFLGLVAIV